MYKLEQVGKVWLMGEGNLEREVGAGYMMEEA